MVPLLVSFLLLGPATARAGTVQSGAIDQDVSFIAAPGEVNVVTVGKTVGGAIAVQDDGAALVAGEGCTSTGLHAAECRLPLSCLTGAELSGGCGFVGDLGDGDDRLTLQEMPLLHAQIQLGAGDDSLDATGPTGVTAFGDAGDDQLLGGDGRDYFVGGPGADFMKGRGGIDTTRYDGGGSTAAVRVSLDGAADDGLAGEHDNAQTENLFGSAGDDLLIGNDVPNFIVGDGGHDTIRCGGRLDTVSTLDVFKTADDCERVYSHDLDQTSLTVLDAQSLRARNGRVRVRLRAMSPQGTVSGSVLLYTRAGRRLGRAPVMSAVGDTSVLLALNRAGRKRLRHDPTLRVRVTAIARSGAARNLGRTLGRLDRS